MRIATEILIEAPPERVWAVLTDLDAYSEWNPFIERASGRVRVGERLQLRIRPPGKSAMGFSPVVLTAQPGVALRWRGRVLLPGVFDGEHAFLLTERDGGTHLLHEERFSGVLVPLLGRAMKMPTKAGFEAMNRALKARAERGMAG